jgi:formylglycine-generating enzyme required for sulfatase activity
MAIDSKRVKETFLEATELSDEAARAAYLDNACRGDTAFRARVEALLRAHDPEGNFLGAPAAVVPDPVHDGTNIIAEEYQPTAQTADDGVFDDEPLTFLGPSTRPGTLGRLGHYEVLQLLGRGGFGIVFRAFDDTLQRVVALKVMAPQLAATSPARKRFLREARSSAQIRHENVVQVYEVVEHPLPYLAMEFIPGETLQQKLDRVGPLDVRETLRIGLQIAEGLAAAHATDLIHRDIKPGNVLLEGGQHKVKITDFGQARAADDASISQSGIIAGTPMYMAPEQALGHKLDQRVDLFSLGSVLYQMVAGRPPFRANTALAVLKRVADDTPRDIREIIPETPQWLCDIIAKLHEKNPDDRYQSARGVADVLADCEAQLKANARLKNYSRIPCVRPRKSGRRKWVAATVFARLAAVILLPAITMVATRLILDRRGTSDVDKSRSDPQAKAPPPAMAPFDAAQARILQKAWANYLGAPVDFTNSIGMKFTMIPPGKFTMGSSREEIGFWLEQTADGWTRGRLPGEGPQHEVEITQPFYMGQTEVTVGQFRLFVKATGYKTLAERERGAYRRFPNGEWKLDADANWLNPGFAQTDDHPVVCVSWDDVVTFCNWLSKLEGKSYRLPREAEWEYSCRAGTNSRWPFGDDERELFNYAKLRGNSQGRTWPVAGLKENAWGLHEMHGNVWEWCQDLYDANYYANSPPMDPAGPYAGRKRVLRGGAWDCWPVSCRSAYRDSDFPDARNQYFGFRLVLVISPPTGGPSESGAKDKPSSPAVTPFADADVQRVAALPAAEQVEEVRKELIRRNPGFDGKLERKIEDGVVTELKIATDQVTDIAPIRVFNALRVLDCAGIPGKKTGLLADLTPLKGINVANLAHLILHNTDVTDAGLATFQEARNLRELNLWRTKVTDAGLAHFNECKDLRTLNLADIAVGDLGLANFKDCNRLEVLYLNNSKVIDIGLANFKDCKELTLLHLGDTQITDAGLIHLQDCKALTQLFLHNTNVTDAGLTNFKGMRLTTLWIYNTGITDLTPLQGMSLEDIRLTPKNISGGLDILRDMKGLKTIGIDGKQAWPAAEFWERYDKGEFKE